ncbi:MAG: site-specific integrase [Phaeodactylibacter xiamenensis]|nr:site-specific integrase [Phaeodactylibacter xiamenensis]MCR9055268.1 site-specific integrase [bacterium]
MKPYRRKIPTPRFLLVSPNNEGRMILLRMTIAKKKRVSFSTGIRVNPKHWNTKAARLKMVRGKEKEYRDINKRLAAFSEIAQDIYIEYDNGKRLDRNTFLEQLAYRSGRKDPPRSAATTLFGFIEQFIETEQSKPTAKRGTWKKYITVFNHLREFAADQGKESLDFSDINWEFRSQFINWLYSPPRSHSQNNAAKIITVTKQFMSEAGKRGLHSNTIYNQTGFGLRRTKVKNKVRLTFAELEDLAAVDLSDTPRLERVRDLFLVGCFTGARFSDWHKVSREHILKEPEGELLQIVTKKVGNRVVIPVFPILKGILDKYEYQLPDISIQKFNAYIKEVCQLVLKDSQFQRIYSKGGQTKTEIVEKWERVSSHAARRSFASNFWEAGIPAALLMQITGHATEKQFFEYIDISQEQAARQFAKMALEVLKKRE